MGVVSSPLNQDTVPPSVLQKPYDLLPLFFESMQFEWMVFTLDLDRNLIYMSESAMGVCKVDSKRWQGQCIDNLLTNHVWNDGFKKDIDINLHSNEIQKTFCEIWNDDSNIVQLEVHRRLIFNQGSPIVIMGIAKRFDSSRVAASKIERVDVSHSSSVSGPSHPFKCLTPGELKVIEMVIDGELNKSIAAKLGIAMRTVEMRRSKAMQKLSVKSLSEMVKLWCRYPQETPRTKQT